jgi:hypothetical protein
MRSFLKKTFLILFSISLFFIVERLCHKATQGFSILNITDPHPFDPRWEVETPTESEMAVIKAALQQPYKIIHAGGQSYAFESSDGKYVLKITKHQRMRIPLWAKLLPSLPSILEKKKTISKEKKKRVFDQTFNSYILAKKSLGASSGILYMHLNKTNNLHIQTAIIDFIGNRYSLNLDNYEFILQVKGVTTFKYLDNLLNNKEEEKAKEAVRKILQFTANRIQMGIEDHDFILFKNFGFYEEEPLQIDIGSLRENPTFLSKNMLRIKIFEVKDQLEAWAKESHPGLLADIDAITTSVIDESPQTALNKDN